MVKSRDIRVIRTQTALLIALDELLKTNKLSTITITELCSKAKINRNTFYYHYNNIYEFLNDQKQIIIDELTSIPDIKNTRNKKSLVEVLNIIKQHPDFMRVLISPNCDLAFFNEKVLLPFFSLKIKYFLNYPEYIYSKSNNRLLLLQVLSQHQNYSSGGYMLICIHNPNYLQAGYYHW